MDECQETGVNNLATLRLKGPDIPAKLRKAQMNVRSVHPPAFFVNDFQIFD